MADWSDFYCGAPTDFNKSNGGWMGTCHQRVRGGGYCYRHRTPVRSEDIVLIDGDYGYLAANSAVSVTQTTTKEPR